MAMTDQHTLSAMPPPGNEAVVRSQRYLLLAQIARLGLFLAATRYLGAALSPAEFGFFALVSGVFAVAVEILDGGTSATVTRQIAQDPANEAAHLGTLLAWRRMVAGMLALTCLVAAALVPAPAWQRYVLAAAAGGLYLLHLNAYQLVFQVRQRFGQPLLLGLSLQALFLLACHGALRGTVTILVPLFVVLREIAQVIVMRALAVHAIGHSVYRPHAWRNAASLWRETWQFGVCALVYKLVFHSGSFSLYWLAPPDALGSYSAALRVFLPVLELSWVFVTPLIASMSAGGLRRQLDTALSLHLGAACLFAVCAWLLAPVILQVLYGQRYSSGALSALLPFRWLCITFASSMVTPVLVVATLASRREAGLLATSLMALVLNIALNMWAVPRWGASGAAIACCTTELFILVRLLLRFWINGSWRPRAGLLLYLAPGAAMATVLPLLVAWPLASLALVLVTAPLLLLWLWQNAQRNTTLEESAP